MGEFLDAEPGYMLGQCKQYKFVRGSQAKVWVDKEFRDQLIHLFTSVRFFERQNGTENRAMITAPLMRVKAGLLSRALLKLADRGQPSPAMSELNPHSGIATSGQ